MLRKRTFSFESVCKYLGDEFQTLDFVLRPLSLGKLRTEEGCSDDHSPDLKRDRNVRFKSPLTCSSYIFGGFRGKILTSRYHDQFAREYLAGEPRKKKSYVCLNSSVGGAHAFSCPLMSCIQTSICGIYLHDGAAIEIQCKHDRREPPLYGAIDLLDRHADEGGGQIPQQLLEIHDFRLWSGVCGQSSLRLRAVLPGSVEASTHSFRRRRDAPKGDL